MEYASAITRLTQRMLGVVGVGRTTAHPVDAGNVHYLQGRLNPLELKAKTPSIEHFGFASLPPVGSDYAVLYINGDRTNGVIVATNHQPSRMQIKNLAMGDAALYDARGAKLHLTPTGLVIDMAGQAVTLVNCSQVIIPCDVHVTGRITATGDVIGNSISLDHHTHPVGGGSTGQPTV